MTAMTTSDIQLSRLPQKVPWISWGMIVANHPYHGPGEEVPDQRGHADPAHEDEVPARVARAPQQVRADDGQEAQDAVHQGEPEPDALAGAGPLPQDRPQRLHDDDPRADPAKDAPLELRHPDGVPEVDVDDAGEEIAPRGAQGAREDMLFHYRGELAGADRPPGEIPPRAGGERGFRVFSLTHSYPSSKRGSSARPPIVNTATGS